jgi:hypothetical protein
MPARSIFACLISGILCVSLLSAGCSVRRITYNETIANNQVQFIRIGQTSLSEVVSVIGTPDDVSEADAGFVALYNWSDTRSAAVDFGVLARIFLPYSPTMTLNRAGISLEQFQVVFDPQWRVRAYGFSRRGHEDSIIWFWPF